MERFLALDIGDRRIGIAVSDPFNGYALPAETYTRKNLRVDLEYIRKTAEEKLITHIVCGLPVNFDGTESTQTVRARYFIEKLRETVKAQVLTEDERCTTTEAEGILISENMDRKKRKLYVDSLAAASILEAFLNDRNRRGENLKK